MKQSTKLLSMILAIIMAFSCFSVVGSAASKNQILKNEIAYDSIDDAVLTPNQVATIILDLLDREVLPGLGVMDLGGILSLDMHNIDSVFNTLGSYLPGHTLFPAAKGLVPLLKELNLGAFVVDGTQHGAFQHPATCTRVEQGDLEMIRRLVVFLAQNAETLSKAAYGFDAGKGGLNVGNLVKGMLPANISDLLNNIPAHAVMKTYNKLLAGRPGYEDAKINPAKTPADVPAAVNNLDALFNELIYSAATQPFWKAGSDWVTVPEGQTSAWSDLVVMPTLAKMPKAEAKKLIDINKNSAVQLLDNIAQIAIDDIVIPNLNNHFKRGLMYATNARFDEVDLETLPADVKAAFGGDNAKKLRQPWNNFIYQDKMFKSTDGVWFFSDVVEEQVLAADGVTPVIDPVTKQPEIIKRRAFYKVNSANAWDTYNLINWDYNLVRSDATEGKTGINFIDYKAELAKYGSITAALNHIMYLIYENGLTQEYKDIFDGIWGYGWLDGTNDQLLLPNGEPAVGENINSNILRMAKFAVAFLLDDVLGEDYPFKSAEDPTKNATPEEVIGIIMELDLEDLLMQFLPMFNLIMPQFIMPAQFHKGTALIEFGTVVLREFLSDVAPGINYDKYIFADGKVTGADDRALVETPDANYWYNLGINMAMDLGYDYLHNVTNFTDATPAQDITEARWMGMLDKIIMWAANYLGTGKSSPIQGLEPDTIAKVKGNALDRLSYVLNLILPLGFISNCGSKTYDFDVNVVFQKMKDVTAKFDLIPVLNCLGRNTQSKGGNLILTDNLVKTILDFANRTLKLIARVNLIPNTANCNAVNTQATFKTVIKTLLTALDTNKDHLLNNILPIVAKFVPGWGTEQEFGTPVINLPNRLSCVNGETMRWDDGQNNYVSHEETISVRNGSVGVWRHYVDKQGNGKQDEMYKIQLVDVKATPYAGDKNYVTVTNIDKTTKADLGQTTTFKLKVKGAPAQGAVVRIDVSYKVYGEDGQAMAGGKVFTVSKYSYINYNRPEGTKWHSPVAAESKTEANFVESTFYVPLSTAPIYLGNMVTTNARYTGGGIGAGRHAYIKITDKTPRTIAGITFGDASFDFPNNKDGWSYDVKNFSTYSVTYGGNTTKIAGSVDEAKWKEANKKDGDGISFDVTVTAEKDNGWAGKPSMTQSGAIKIKFFDDINRNHIISLVNQENKMMRVKDQYKQAGTTYLDRELLTADGVDEKGNPVKKETNFAAANVDGKMVTAINNAEAWAKYETALRTAIRLAYQDWNADSVFGFAKAYEDLRVAALDVDRIKKPANEITTGDNIDAAVDDLKAKRDEVKALYFDGQDYTDYRLYRHNRFYKAYEDASALIDLKAAAKVQNVDTKRFPYGNLSEAQVEAAINGYKDAKYIRALYEDLDQKQIDAANKKLLATKASYGSRTLLDVAMAKNLLTLTADRLILKYADGKGNRISKSEYLQGEITSCDELIIPNKSAYTAKSWAIFQKRYDEAKAALAKGYQSAMFDAKYELMCARNRLVLVEDEADYAELDQLIKQAQTAIANKQYYNNTDKDWGLLIAALGVDEAETNGTQLFYGSALREQMSGYAKKDQEKLDNAADALKVALARLKFAGVEVKYDNTKLGNDIVVDANPDKNIEEVRVSTATVAVETIAKDVIAKLGITGQYDDIVVSGDPDYGYGAVITGAVGTGATITVYRTVSGVNVPIKTVKVIVKNDINGDAAADVLDAVYANLCATERSSISGVYLLAGDSDGNRKLDGADYTAIVNAAKGA